MSLCIPIFSAGCVHRVISNGWQTNGVDRDLRQSSAPKHDRVWLAVYQLLGVATSQSYQRCNQVNNTVFTCTVGAKINISYKQQSFLSEDLIGQ